MLLIPSIARADGSMSFTTTPQKIIAGQPFSSMEKGIDWVTPQQRTNVGGVFVSVVAHVTSIEKRPGWRFFGKRTPLPRIEIDTPPRLLKHNETMHVTISVLPETTRAR